MRLSIKVRFVLISSLINILSLGILGGIGLAWYRAETLRSLDTFLEADAQGLVEAIESFMAATLHDFPSSRLSGGIMRAIESAEFGDALREAAAAYTDKPLIYKTTIMVYDRGGRSLFTSNNALPDSMPSSESLTSFEKAKTRAESVLKTIEDGRHLEYRVVSIPVFYLGKPVVLVQETCLTASLDASFDRLRTMFLAGLPLVWFLSALIMFLLLTRAFTPVTDIVAIIRRITGDSLKVRVPLPPGDDEITSLAETFNGMLDRLDAAFESQVNLVQDLSHQLRTPLSVLKGSLETGLRRERTIGEYEELMISNLEEVNRISRLIERLLFLARLDHRSEEMSFEEIDLEAFLAGVVEDLGPLWLQKDVKVVTEGCPGGKISGDAILLRQVIINLLDNAWKHTAVGGTITIHPELNSAQCLIRIHNDGQPIPEKDLRIIFERFYRSRAVAPGANRGNPVGFGLGLPIARAIAELHGGRIDAENPKSGGVDFIVRLPGLASLH